jgi:GNAT superfamily N-acetyltransferase
MPIRFATLSDVPAMVESAGRVHVLTRFGSKPYDAQKVAQAFTELIEQRKSKYGFFVAEDDAGRIVGTLIGVIEERILSDACIACVMHLDVLPGSRRGDCATKLLKAFETWSANRGAIEIEIGVGGAETRALGRFARKMGYRAVGGNYLKQAGA